MEYLRGLNLVGTAVEELPLSIGNLTRLGALILHGCRNLVRLPINNIFQSQRLSEIRISGCRNLVKKIGDDRQSLLSIESTTMDEDILSSEEQLQELVAPMNSSNESNALQVLNRQNCFQSDLNFFPIFFNMFTFVSTLYWLDLSGTKMVSLPTSIKGFVSLTYVHLCKCMELEEILEVPPNIRFVNVKKCKWLERFSEVSKILKFNGSHIRSLKRIQLSGCDKMHEKIWNYKVPNTLLWMGYYDAAVLPENQIPEWFRYQKEFLENQIMKRGHNDVQLKGNKESVINIEGPHYLENISGIVIYTLTFCKKGGWYLYLTDHDAEINSDSSNHVCRIGYNESVILINDYKDNVGAGYEVGVRYSDLKSFGLKVLDNLRV